MRISKTCTVKVLCLISMRFWVKKMNSTKSIAKRSQSGASQIRSISAIHRRFLALKWMSPLRRWVFEDHLEHRAFISLTFFSLLERSKQRQSLPTCVPDQKRISTGSSKGGEIYRNLYHSQSQTNKFFLEIKRIVWRPFLLLLAFELVADARKSRGCQLFSKSNGRVYRLWPANEKVLPILLYHRPIVSSNFEVQSIWCFQFESFKF